MSVKVRKLRDSQLVYKRNELAGFVIKTKLFYNKLRTSNNDRVEVEQVQPLDTYTR